MNVAMSAFDSALIHSSNVSVSTPTIIFSLRNVSDHAISSFSVHMDQPVGSLLRVIKSDREIPFEPERRATLETDLLTFRTTQNRRQEARQIINCVLPWSGSIRQAFVWYRSEPIPAFGNRTAEELVREGRAEHLESYLAGLSIGGYA